MKMFSPDSSTAPKINQEWRNKKLEIKDENGDTLKDVEGNVLKTEKARRVYDVTETRLEYGAKTWSTKQTVIDLFQNHLDAQSEILFQQIFDCLIDQERFLEIDEEERSSTIESLSSLYNYVILKNLLDSKNLKEYECYLYAHFYKLSHLLKEGFDNPKSIFAALNNMSYSSPRVYYNLVNTENGDEYVEISYEELKTSEQFKDSKYKIIAFRVLDSGSGYDHQLASNFISGKQSKPYLRGKYGEGLKMSLLHSKRAGASIRQSSSYVYQDSNSNDNTRKWRTDVHVIGDDDKSKMVAVGAEIEHPGTSDTGSTVSINFAKADKDFVEEVTANIDPRQGEGLGGNVLEYSDSTFEFSFNTPDVLVSFDISDAPHSYVKGLNISTQKDARPQTLFNYLFLDNTGLNGRDRNKLSEAQIRRIVELLTKSTNIEFYKKFIRSYIKLENIYDAPEEDAMCALIWGKYKDLSVYHKSRSDFLSALEEVLFPDRNKRYLLFGKRDYKRMDDGKGFENEILQDKIKQGFEIVVVPDGVFTRVGSWSGAYGERVVTFGQLAEENKLKNRETGTVGEEDFNQLENTTKKGVAGIVSLSVRELGDLYSPCKYINIKYVSTRSDKPLEPRFGGWSSLHDAFKIEPETLEIDVAKLAIFLEANGEAKTLQLVKVALLAVATDERGTSEKRMPELQRVCDSAIGQAYYTLPPEDRTHIESLFDRNKQVYYNPDSDENVAKALSVKDDPEEYKKEARLWRLRCMPDIDLVDLKDKEVLGSGDITSRPQKKGDLLYYYDSNKKMFKCVNLKKLPRTIVNGINVYKFSQGRYFFELNLLQGDTVEKGQGKDKLVLVHGGSIMYAYDKNHVLSYSDRAYDFNYASASGFVLYKYDDDESVEDWAAEKLGEYTVKRAVTTQQPQIIASSPDGLVSSISTQYGVGEWDNPVRVFQDLYQNHQDAGDATINFIVVRNGVKIKISSEKVKPEDSIVGVVFEDDGDGYSYESIHVLGETSKKSPVYSGKYGEGAKLVAASCIRNKISLTHSSFVKTPDGKVYWQAEATQKLKKIVINGKEVDAPFVGFDLNTNIAEDLKSRTEIELPEFSDEATREQWAKWIEVLDPRKKDDKGYAGLGRYVRQVRGEAGHVIENGDFKIILNEPGIIYENGFSLGLSANMDYLPFGVDAPLLCSTRERNAVDTERVYDAIRIAFEGIDSGEIERVMKLVIDSVFEEVKIPVTGMLSVPESKLSLLNAFIPVARKCYGSLVGYVNNKLGADAYWTSEHNADVSIRNLQAVIDRFYTGKRRALHVSKDLHATLDFLGLPTTRHIVKSAKQNEISAPEEVEASLEKLNMLAYEYVARTLKVSHPEVVSPFKRIVRTLSELANINIKQTKKGTFLDQEEIRRLEGFIESGLKGQRGKAKVCSPSPFHAGYTNTSTGRVTYSVDYVNKKDFASLWAIALHEAVHNITQARDFEYSFVRSLLEVALSTEQVNYEEAY